MSGPLAQSRVSERQLFKRRSPGRWGRSRRTLRWGVCLRSDYRRRFRGKVQTPEQHQHKIGKSQGRHAGEDRPNEQKTFPPVGNCRHFKAQSEIQLNSTSTQSGRFAASFLSSPNSLSKSHEDQPCLAIKLSI